MDHILVNITTLGLLLFICRLEAFKNTKFCVKNPNNTLCIYPDDGPGRLCEDYEKTTITNSEKLKIVLWHIQILNEGLNNQEAKFLGRVNWDEELAAIAQKWASQCRLAKDSNRHFGNNSVEQNIFSVSAAKGESYNIVDLLKMSEKQFKEKDSENATHSKSLGNILKQWKRISVGCGGSTYSIMKGNMKFHELVCNYIHATDGNVSNIRYGIKKRDKLINGQEKTLQMKRDRRQEDLEVLRKVVTHRKKENMEEDEDEYAEYEDPFEMKDIEFEIEKRIDEQFGPFRGFFVSTERHINPTVGRVGSGMDLRINKDFEEFENAGAAMTSKGKYVLWAMRNDGYGCRPKYYTVFASSTVVFLYHLFAAP